MARARNIKPAFFQNEELSELSPITRLAFIGMWTISDFKGCIEFRPKRLKVQLMPYDDCDFEEIAINLDKSGLISIYSVAGQRYIKIINFVKHQNPHKNERDAGSDIPDIEPKDNVHAVIEGIQIIPDKDGTDRAESLLLIPSSLIPDSGLIDSANSAPAAPKKSRAEAKKPLPDGFGISENVRAWAITNGHQHLDRHLASFLMKVRAKGYVYVNWDAAFQNAIADDWAKLNVGNAPRGSPRIPVDLAAANRAATEEARRKLFPKVENYNQGVIDA